MLNNLDEFLNWLDGFMNFERLPCRDMLKLETMQKLCDALGNPERSYKVVHVAGSKGKGSTCRMIAEAVAAETGRNVGIYASPHLVDFRERVSGTAGFFADEIYLAAANEVMVAAERAQGETWAQYVTWFELVTAFGFCAFRQAGCEWAVIEVGMGGRLDATNIVKPELAVITTLELEHCEYLGNTLEEIAEEKCGIVKPGVPVVIAEQEIAGVVAEIAKKRGAGEIRIAHELGAEMQLGMRGKIQRKNAATAMAGGELLGLSAESMLKGLAKARLPGRFEERELGDGSRLVIDAAHTASSIRATLETWEELAQEYNNSPRYLLIGLAADKNAEEIAAAVAGVKFDRVFATRPGDFKKSDLPRLAAALESNGVTAEVDEDFGGFIPEVLRQARENRAILLATGSFYLLAEVEKALQESKNVL